MKTPFLLLILCLIGESNSRRRENEVKEFPFDTNPSDSNYLIKHYFNSAFGELDRTDKREIYKLHPFLSGVDLNSTNLLISAYIEAVLNNTNALNLTDLPNIRKQSEGSEIDDKRIRQLLKNILKESKKIIYEDILKIYPQYALPSKIKLKNKFMNDYIDFVNYIVEETDFERIELDKNYKPNLNAELNDINNAAEHKTQQPSLLNLNLGRIPSPVIPEVNVPEVQVNPDVDLSAFNVDGPVTPTVVSPDVKVQYKSGEFAEPEESDPKDDDTITVIEAPEVKNNPANFDKLDKMKVPSATFNDKPVEKLNLSEYLIDEIATPRIDFKDFLKLETPKKEPVHTENPTISVENDKPTTSNDLESTTAQADVNKPTTSSDLESISDQAYINKHTTFTKVESTTAQADVNKSNTESNREFTTGVTTKPFSIHEDKSTTISDLESTTQTIKIKPTVTSDLGSTTHLETTTTSDTTIQIASILEHTTSSAEESTTHITTTEISPALNIETVTHITTTTSEIASTTETTETTTKIASTSNVIELPMYAGNTDSTPSVLDVGLTLETTTQPTRYTTFNESDLTTDTFVTLPTLPDTTNYNHTTSPGFKFTDVTISTFPPDLLLNFPVNNGYTEPSFIPVTSSESTSNTLESTLSPISTPPEPITSRTSTNTDFTTTETVPSFTDEFSTAGIEELASTIKESSHETTSVATTAVTYDVPNSTETNPTTESSDSTTSATLFPILPDNLSAKDLLPYEIQDYMKNNYPPERGYPIEDNTNDKSVYHPAYESNDNEEFNKPSKIIEQSIDTMETTNSETVGYKSNYYPITPHYRYPGYPTYGLYRRTYFGNYPNSARPFLVIPRFIYGHQRLN